MRTIRGGGFVAVLVASAAISISGVAGVAAAKPDPAQCPAGIASSSSAVQWVWSAIGAPSSAAASVSSSVSGGHGTWRKGQAGGTICVQLTGSGGARRNVVLTVSGPSKLSPSVTKLHELGIGLVLAVTVSATDDAAACPDATTGTVRLFASYYEVHKDRAILTFAAPCAGDDLTFEGSILHVEIARDGHQITSLGDA
jgi:hypothetical protein